jgi:ABC-type dipeptide/oligopeptide/nickel transport system ATPase subunit
MTVSLIFWKVMFCSAVVVICLVAIFPFCEAVLTSFESGTAIFRINDLPEAFNLDNYITVMNGRNLIRSVLNSVFIAALTVAAALFRTVTSFYALTLTGSETTRTVPVAIGLLSGASHAQRDERALKAARMLQIEHLLDRLPKELSGGQRHRVAIGRAITRDPRVFLFDEPLSNLNAALRVAMRLEIAKPHREMNDVTYDQVEAMTLADRICMLRDGRPIR